MHSSDDDKVMDHNIQQLLLEAEGRLRSAEASQIRSGPEASEHNLTSIPKLLSNSSLQPYVRQQDDVATADTSYTLNVTNKTESKELGSVVNIRKSLFKQDKPNSGDSWFNLPKTELTPELKRDFQLLRMRSVLDPKRHYKKENGKFNVPAYSQVGTIVQGPTEFFSSRITKKDRRKTFVEEALALERETGRFKSKYNDIQATKQSGKKSYYGSLRAKRNSKAK